MPKYLLRVSLESPDLQRGRTLPTQRGGPSSQHELRLHLHRWKLTVTSFDPWLQTNTVAVEALRAAPQSFWSGTSGEGGICFHLPLPDCICCLCLQLVRKCHKSRVWLVSMWKDILCRCNAGFDKCSTVSILCNQDVLFVCLFFTAFQHPWRELVNPYNKIIHTNWGRGNLASSIYLTCTLLACGGKP